jgi:hypothetical protein
MLSVIYIHVKVAAIVMLTIFITRCGHTHCQTEQEARYYIYQRDSKLYYALSYVYLNYQYTVPSQLATCVTY